MQIKTTLITKGKIISILIPTLFVVVFVILFLKNNLVPKYNLEIYIKPPDASLFIDNKEYEHKGLFKKKMSKGNHKINIKKDGYLEETKNISIEKDTSISFNLRTKKERFVLENAKTEKINNIKITGAATDLNNKIVGVDPQNGNLITIEENKKSVIYKGFVRDFRITKNLIAISDQNIKQKLIIYNQENKNLSEIDIGDLQPISSACILDNLKEAVVITKYDPDRKESSLIKINIEDKKIEELGKTKAQDIDCLGNNTILLSEQVDEIDASVFYVYDIKDKKVVNQQTANKIIISPTREKIALLKTGKIIIFDVPTNKNITNYTNQKFDHVIWFNELTLTLIKNDKSGLIISFIDIGENIETQPQIIPNTQGIFARKIISINNNELYIEGFNKTIELIKIDIK